MSRPRKRKKPAGPYHRYIGVVYDKYRRKWKSTITVARVPHIIGWFENDYQAVKARDTFIKGLGLRHKTQLKNYYKLKKESNTN